MPKHCYRKTRFHPATLKMIGVANTILEDLSAQGYDITLRQLYYQLVGKGLIPNTEKSYKKLGKVINDARLSGLVDWNHIMDQTRNMRSLSTWNGPEDIIKSAAASFRLDKCAEYVKEHGNSSWELDALDPRTIDALIQTTIQGYIDYGPWTKVVNQEKKDLKVMDWAVAEWPAIREAFEDEQTEKGIPK